MASYTDKEFVIIWNKGYEPIDFQTDPCFYRSTDSFIGTVRLKDFVVRIYCDGEMVLDNKTNRETYYTGGELVDAGFNTDEKLWQAGEKGELEWRNNPWFDLYVNGEHLDCVTHSIDEAVNAAKAFLSEEVANAERIELDLPEWV